MTTDNLPEFRRVSRALHRPLTVAGVDRRLFFMALLVGAAAFNLFYSLLAGCVLFTVLYVVARWSTAREPQMLHILLRSGAARRRYDPAKYAADAAPRIPFPNSRKPVTSTSRPDDRVVMSSGTAPSGMPSGAGVHEEGGVRPDDRTVMVSGIAPSEMPSEAGSHHSPVGRTSRTVRQQDPPAARRS